MKKKMIMAAAVACFTLAGLSSAVSAAEVEETAVETSADGTDATAASVTAECDKFSVSIPARAVELCDIETASDSIAIYEKIAHEDGAGFVGSINLYENVHDYCDIPNFARGGEISYPDNTKLDIVLTYPSDVQYDFNSEESVNAWMALQDIFNEEIAPSIQPREEGTFIPQNEVDNTSIYDETLAALYQDLLEKKDQAALEEDDFSYLYAMNYEEGEDPLYTFGYTFVDLTGTGYPELVIMKDDGSPIVYDLFTQTDGKVRHVFSSAERDYVTLLGHEGHSPRTLCEHTSGGADVTEINTYIMDPGTKELISQVSFIYDATENQENPWAVRYGFDEEPEALDEAEWNQRMENFGVENLFKLIPIAAADASADADAA